jgi:predicted PurR-regulated permease PerM
VSRAEALSWATGALSSLVGTLGALLIVFLSGIFVAATPSTYVRGLLHLVPLGGRPRARQVIVQVEDALGRWMLSKVFRMFLVGALTWAGLALLGIPLALTLGIIAGLLTFIPNIGPILALVPTVLLALMEGPMRALYVVALYVGIQQVENNIVTPLLEKKMLSLPPALTLAMQVFMGILVGPVGVAIASPLTAAGLVMVRMLYVEDVLHDHSATP